MATSTTITIHNLDQHSAKEVFDFIKASMLEQGERCSIDADTNCQYRTIKEDGTVLKCAAGFLIPDDDYKPGMEGETWVGLISHNYIPDQTHQTLIFDLQKIHDEIEPKNWVKELDWYEQDNFSN